MALADLVQAMLRVRLGTTQTNNMKDDVSSTFSEFIQLNIPICPQKSKCELGKDAKTIQIYSERQKHLTVKFIKEEAIPTKL